MKTTVPYTEFTREESKDKGFHSDIYDFDERNFNDIHSWKIVETTASYLASIKASPFCGDVKDWVKTAKKFPDLKVRTVIVEIADKTSGETRFKNSSCDIYIQSEKEFEKVEKLCGMRGNFNKAGWTYFETE